MTIQAKTQQVRYPGLQPPSAAAQALLGFLKGAGGYMKGRNEAQAAIADRQAKAFNVVAPALINKGYMGPVAGAPSTVPGIPGLGATTPLPDASDVLARMRTRKIGQETMHPDYPVPPELKKKQEEELIVKTLFSDIDFQHYLKEAPSSAALILENSLKVQSGEITSEKAKAAILAETNADKRGIVAKIWDAVHTPFGLNPLNVSGNISGAIDFFKGRSSAPLKDKATDVNKLIQEYQTTNDPVRLQELEALLQANGVVIE